MDVLFQDLLHVSQGFSLYDSSQNHASFSFYDFLVNWDSFVGFCIFVLNQASYRLSLNDDHVGSKVCWLLESLEFKWKY